MADPFAFCDRCLGRRLIGALGEVAQTEAGASHRRTAGGPAPPRDADCPVCEGRFGDEGAWLGAALAAARGHDYATFQVGTRFPEACEQREKGVVLQEAMTDTIRTEANRLLAPAIAAATGAEVVHEGRPDVSIIVDTRFWVATVTSQSVFVAGRYTKHRRDVPQTHWPCKTCQGLGCHRCHGSGTMYGSSVEDVVAGVLVPAFQADGAAFHGAGREDIDALMLGTGRPFVLELKGPRRRSVDLDARATAVNTGTEAHGVGVSDLRMADKETVVRLKEGIYDKSYLAHCVADAPVSPDELGRAAAAAGGIELQQQTPQRVAHRRADKVRRRTVHSVRVEAPPSGADATRFSIAIDAASGTYIKEFVSGDEGRTNPSFSTLLGVPCVVEALDVVGVDA